MVAELRPSSIWVAICRAAEIGIAYP